MTEMTNSFAFMSPAIVNATFERIIMDIHDENSFDTILHVGLPERTLDASYGLPFAEGWALVITVVGVGIIGLAYRYHKC